MEKKTGCELFHLTFDRAVPYLLMVGLQFGSAGMFIISMVTLSHGMSRYVFIVYRNAVAALVLAPFALLLERKIRPKMTTSNFFRIMALGFLEPIIDQNLTYLGMNLTSASYASAITNVVPAITFVIATIFRLERVKITEARSQAKVGGTLVTLAGALVMAMYKGPIIDLVWSHGQVHHSGSPIPSDKHWIIGTLFILLACVAWSGFYVLQSITIKTYPAELSLSSLICLMGSLQSAALAVAIERHPSAWAVGWNSRLLAPLYTGIVSSGITYYVQGMVMKTRGPVFATAFNPLCMIIVAIFGSLILAEKLHLGSVIGGIIIAVGLYSVVWGKGKDNITTPSPEASIAGETCEAERLPITAINNTNGNVNLVVEGEPAAKSDDYDDDLTSRTSIFRNY